MARAAVLSSTTSTRRLPVPLVAADSAWANRSASNGLGKRTTVVTASEICESAASL